MLAIVDAVPIEPAELRRIGARLRELRRHAGESQQQTAVAVGIVRSYLSQIEAGRKNITLDTLYSLAEHFGEPPASLLVSAPSTHPQMTASTSIQSQESSDRDQLR